MSADNNHAERQIRPAVVLRKNSYGNRSQEGADVQAIIMSVMRTIKLRGHHPVDAVQAMVEGRLQSGRAASLPPLLESPASR